MSNESKRGAGSNSRVYRSTDVHKRRAPGSGRADKPGLLSRVAGLRPTDEQAPEEQAAEDQPTQMIDRVEGGVENEASLQGSVPEVEAAKTAAIDVPAAEAPAAGSPLAGIPAVEAPADKTPAIAGLPEVMESAPAPEEPPAKPADEIAKAAEEIKIDDTIDRQTFDSMPTTRLQAIGEFVARKRQDLGAAAESSQGADSDGAVDGSSPTLMEHAAFSRQAGADADANVSKIDPGKFNDESAKRRRTVVAVTAVIAVVIVAAIAIFAWNRWGRYDDLADVQGQWYVVGTTTPVQIDESTIKLTDQISYEYAIDQNEKTIKYRFGTMEGQGRYWFSDNRQYLVIADGKDYTGADTTVEDLVRQFTELTASVTGQEITLPEGDGIIAFSREADPKAQAAKDQAAQKAKEEQERQSAGSESSGESASAASASSAASSTSTDEDGDESYYEEDISYDEGDDSTDGSGASAETSEEESEGDVSGADDSDVSEVDDSEES